MVLGIPLLQKPTWVGAVDETCAASIIQSNNITARSSELCEPDKSMPAVRAGAHLLVAAPS